MRRDSSYSAQQLPRSCLAWPRLVNDDGNSARSSVRSLAGGSKVTGSATDVPVLVRLSLANFEFFTIPSRWRRPALHRGDDKTALKVPHRTLRSAGADGFAGFKFRA
jgi:hypothetical protein